MIESGSLPAFFRDWLTANSLWSFFKDHWGEERYKKPIGSVKKTALCTHTFLGAVSHCPLGPTFFISKRTLSHLKEGLPCCILLVLSGDKKQALGVLQLSKPFHFRANVILVTKARATKCIVHPSKWVCVANDVSYAHGKWRFCKVTASKGFPL